MATSREQAVEFLKKEFDGEPEANRGVPLSDPIDLGLDEKPEAEEQPNAEGQEARPEEVSEDKEDQEERVDDAEGHADKITAKAFADQAGWTLEEFYRDIVVPTDDGEATLSEVVDGYKELRSENDALKTERQQLQDQAKVQPSPLQQYAPEALALVDQIDNLSQAYEKEDWDKMESADAVNLRMRYKDEIEKREKLAQRIQSEHVQKVEKQMQEMLNKAQVQMLSDIPEWRSDKVRVSEQKGIEEYLRSEGADQARIDQILKMDPWGAKMVRRLWKLEQTHAKTKRAVKKVEKMPKSLTPSERTKSEKPSLKSVGKKLHQAGKLRDRGRTRDKLLMETEFEDGLL